MQACSSRAVPVETPLAYALCIRIATTAISAPIADATIGSAKRATHHTKARNTLEVIAITQQSASLPEAAYRRHGQSDAEAAETASSG
jgi:hypothetical protein